MNQNNKPTMLYDGDCEFCNKWILKWKKLTNENIVYRPFQEVKESYPEITEESFNKGVKLILPDKNIYTGAHALFKALSISGKFKSLLWLYEKAPLAKPISEQLYRLIASHRNHLSKRDCTISDNKKT